MDYTLLFVKDRKDSNWGFYGLYFSESEANDRKKELESGEVFEDYIFQKGNVVLPTNQP